MTLGSLFTGIGGFDRGFESAGFRVAWQVENEPFCIQVLERDWPHVARFGDVRKWACNRDEHSCDWIVGGFPCQDLSVAGRRAGLAGKRSGLFWELVRVASVLRPDGLVLENVPGLLSSERGRDMGTVVGALGDIGYCVAWRVLDAQFFGMPQRRRRVFLVCHPDPERAAAILFEPESGAGHSAALREARADLAYCLDAGAGGISGKEQRRTLVGTITPGAHPGSYNGQDAYTGHLIAGNIRSRNSGEGVNMPGRGGEDDHNLIVHTLTGEGHDGSEDGSGRGTPLVFNPQSGGDVWLGVGERPTAISGTQTPAVAYNIVGSGQNSRSHAYRTERTGAIQHKGNCASGNEAGTLIAAHGAPPDSDRMRALSGIPGPFDVCEVCAKGPDSPRYKAIGNAVVPAVAEWIARRIMETA